MHGIFVALRGALLASEFKSFEQRFNRSISWIRLGFNLFFINNLHNIHPSGANPGIPSLDHVDGSMLGVKATDQAVQGFLAPLRLTATIKRLFVTEFSDIRIAFHNIMSSLIDTVLLPISIIHLFQ